MARMTPSVVDRGADLVHLLARMIGRDQVLAAVLDPFHRTAESLGGDADQNVLRIKLAANAEAAADMGLVDMDRSSAAGRACATAVPDCGAAPWRRRAIPGCRATRRSGRWRRAFPAARRSAGRRRVQARRCGGLAEHGIDVAIALADHRRLRCCGPARTRPASACASSTGGSSSISMAIRSAASSAT